MAVCDLSPQVIEFLQRANTHPSTILRYEETLPLSIILPPLADKISGCSLKDAVQWTNAIFSAFDIPLNLRGILHAESVFRYWVPLLLQENPPIETTVAIAILKQLFTDLNNYKVNKLDKGLFNIRPRVEHEPLLAFHVAAFSPIPMSTSPCPLYELWGRTFHKGLREIQSTTSKLETLRGYATSARLFFIKFPHASVYVDRSGPITLQAFKSHVDSFQQGYTAQPPKKRRKHPVEEIADEHRSRLLRLFQTHGVRESQHDGGSPSEDERSRSLDHSVSVEYIDDNPATRHVDAREDVPPIRAGVARIRLEDEGTPSDDGQDEPEETVSEWICQDEQAPLLRHPPHIPYHYVSRYYLYQYDFFWDSKVPAPHTLVELYKAVEHLSRLDPAKYGALCLMLLVPLFTGRDVRELEESVIAPYPTKAESRFLDFHATLFFDVRAEWFFFHQDTLRSSFQPPEASGWLASTAWVPFPLPQPLLNIWRTYCAWLQDVGQTTPGSPVLQNVDEKGQIKPLKAKDVHGLLTRAGVDARLIPRVSDLCRGFRGWLVHGFGMNDVMAYFISGQLTSVGVKPRYTHLIVDKFHDEYQGCCNDLHKYVSSHLPLSGWWNNRPAVAGHIRDQVSVYGIGSPLVLGETALREEIEKVGNAVHRTSYPRKPNEVIAHHNASVTYAALAALTLGIRPRNDFGFLQSDYLADFVCIPIIDKLSSLYIEDRLMGFPPTVRHLFRELATGRAGLIHMLKMYFGYPAEQELESDRLFVFLMDNGSIRPFSLRTLRELLTAFGSHRLAQGPLNMGRHYNRSCKVPWYADDTIDFHIGHQRAGREPFCAFGSAFIGQALKLLQDHHEDLVTRLGFRKLPYFPKTK